MSQISVSAGQPQTGRVKDVEEVRRHYDAGWRAYLDVAEAALKEEGPNLGRILGHCLATRSSGERKQRGRFRPRIGGEPLSDRVPHACHLAYYTSVLVETIRNRLPDGTGRIVEMGSGWGAVITSLWLSGAPRNAEYWALEYTDAGRRLSSLFASMEAAYRLETRAFDYHQPDFSEITGPAKTVVFSTYSIEQITYIKDELIERILAIPGFARCIHVEPVGWQVEPGAPLARFDRFAKKLGLPPLDQAAASRRRCWRKRKNRNLLETLRRFEAAGRIVIEEIDADLVANDPLNPGTLVVWRPA